MRLTFASIGGDNSHYSTLTYKYTTLFSFKYSPPSYFSLLSPPPSTPLQVLLNLLPRLLLVAGMADLRLDDSLPLGRPSPQ